MADSAKKKMVQDALVEALVPDPSRHEATTQLSGWLGKSATAGVWRLYLTPQLNTYVEFAEDDVVHTRPLDASESPLGGTTIWIKAGVMLRHTEVVTRQVEAGFLSGGVTSGFMAGTNPALPSQAQRTAIHHSNDYVCSSNPHIPVCQNRTEACGTFGCPPGGTFGPSAAFVCGVTVGCSVGFECSVGCK